MQFPKGVIGLVGESGCGAPAVAAQAIGALLVDELTNPADAVQKLQREWDIEQSRRQGRTVLILSHDTDWLRRIADEVWWIQNGEVAFRGDPSETLSHYARHTASRVKLLGREIAPTLRRGDGRAEIVSLKALNSTGQPTATWSSGEQVAIEVKVRFATAVESPVVGIMIRTRIGFEVYGTNTELEKVAVGPCQAGEDRLVKFEFSCELCPQYYTVTAASHDPDGVWHDWMEDAIAVTVIDDRYTAGVANLRARVEST